jgi:Ammonium Transporter Family
MGRRRLLCRGLRGIEFIAWTAFALVLLLTTSVPANANKLDQPATVETLTYNLSLAWVLLAGFLVMFMQLGFALLETGFTRARNAVNTMAMNLIIYPLGVIGYWLTGYGFMMGGIRRWPSLGTFPLPPFGLHFGNHWAWGALAPGIFADGCYGDGWNGVAGPVRGLISGDVSSLSPSSSVSRSTRS